MPDPYYSDADGLTLLLGDCRSVMAAMPAESVSCVITSPPYFSLRLYPGTESIWGGDPECDHQWGEAIHGGRSDPTYSELSTTSGSMETTIAATRFVSESATCSLCGAWRGQLGLEPMVDCLAWARGEKPCGQCYICHLREVLEGIKRVLRKDGVAWIDIGDSRWAGKGRSGGQSPENADRRRQEGKSLQRAADTLTAPGTTRPSDGYDPIIKPKSLCLIPDRLRLAAQADGWIVRDKIVIKTWMPESARDRCTKSYRELIMLVKGRKYWWDGWAVRMPAADSTMADPRRFSGRHTQRPYLPNYPGGDDSTGQGNFSWYRGSKMFTQDGMRNLGSLWTDLPPANSPIEGHFAVFPVEEPYRCILASTPAEICVKCGKARERIVKVKDREFRRELAHAPNSAPTKVDSSGWEPPCPETIGWTDCQCNAGWIAGLTLDPFIGTGSSAVAARKLGRRCIGIDLSQSYIEGAIKRLTLGDAALKRVAETKRVGNEQGVLL